jgi:hypothetical protein
MRTPPPDRALRLDGVTAVRKMRATFVPPAELDRLAEAERDHDEDVMVSAITGDPVSSDFS